MIGTQNDNLKLALSALGRLVDGNEEAALSVLNFGGLTFLVDFLSSVNESLQLQALRCLNALCSVGKVTAAFLSSVSAQPAGS